MPALATISEMKNHCLPPQPPLNQRRHDAHISPANSSASWSRDRYGRASEKVGTAGDWRQQMFGLQGLVEDEEV